MDKVVLSLDGSEESRAAVRWCIHNRDPATKVIAVCGISEMEEFVLGVPLFDPTAEQAIEEAFKTRGEMSRPVRMSIGDGQPQAAVERDRRRHVGDNEVELIEDRSVSHRTPVSPRRCDGATARRAHLAGCVQMTARNATTPRRLAELASP